MQLDFFQALATVAPADLAPAIPSPEELATVVGRNETLALADVHRPSGNVMWFAFRAATKTQAFIEITPGHTIRTGWVRGETSGLARIEADDEEHAATIWRRWVRDISTAVAGFHLKNWEALKKTTGHCGFKAGKLKPAKPNRRRLIDGQAVIDRQLAMKKAMVETLRLDVSCD